MRAQDIGGDKQRPKAAANVATVDVEDWHALVYRDVTGETLQPTEHVDRGTRILLELFSEAGVRGTFFVTGPCAKCYPELVRDIAQAGHEVACHGWAHRPTWSLSRAELRDDLKRALGTLEDVLGEPVHGYRAPFFSVGPSEMWALDEVAAAGLLYDSSLSPLRFAAQGETLEPGLQRLPAGGPAAGLFEFPMTTIRLMGKQRNIGGGRWFRLLPFGAIRNGFERLNRRGLSGQTYTHSYEVLPYALKVQRPLSGPQSRIKATVLEACYAVGRGRTVPRLTGLFEQGARWAPIWDLVAERVASEESEQP